MNRMMNIVRSFSSYRTAAISKEATAATSEPLVMLSASDTNHTIDDRNRKNDLEGILKDYYEKLNSKDHRDDSKIDVATIIQRMLASESPSAGAGDRSASRKVNVTPEDIYVCLLNTQDRQPQGHTQGISSLAFSFAAILALSLSHGGASQSYLGSDKSYFDLSPLYGANEAEKSSIRRKDGSGMLWPDSFTEERLDMLPDSVPVLLVLWNRYHNYVAKQLFWYNEGDKWKDPTNLSPEQCLTQDDKIFDVARSITCIHFMNVVREDFVKGLIGMPMASPSAHLDILSDAKGKPNSTAGYLSSAESSFLYSFSPFAPSSFTSTIHERESPYPVCPDVRRRNYDKLRRNEHGYFEDNDLAELLFNAIEEKAGSPGGRRVPDWAREHEIQKLKHARQANVCTLNEYRQLLGLKPFQSFEDWNKELASTARNLYDYDVNNLELYPGLLCERSSDSGFGFGHTMTWGLIADIIIRIRCDPMFTSEFNETVLTKWGYKDCILNVDDAKESRSCLHSTGGSLGGILPKLLQRTLPNNCPSDNIYCLFPFIVPEESKNYVENLEKKRYTTIRPKQVKIKVLRTLTAISEALNDPKTFPSPYKNSLTKLTGGYGHFLGFDDLKLHDYDLMLTMFSLMPDRGAAERIGLDFAQKAQECLNSNGQKEGDAYRIDVVKDVIEATCVRWVCETILSLHFKDTFFDSTEARKESKKMAMKEHTDLAYCYTYVFRNTEPEFEWNARERALVASSCLSQRIQNYVSIYDHPPETLGRGDQYSNGKMVLQHHADTFIDRMLKLKARQLAPLKHLTTANNDHHAELEKKALKNVFGEAAQFWTAVKRHFEGKATALEILRGLSAIKKDVDISDRGIQHKAWQDFQESWVVANVMGLAVVISVHFSKACAQVVDFYLDDKYAREREELVEICKEDNTSNEKIMAYAWEALRIKQRFGLWRDVALLPNDKKIIEQGFGYPNITIEPGDRVFADFTYAHNDPKQVQKPEKVKLDRQLNSLLGLGVHKCPARSFIQQTMSQMIRVIFKQEGLERYGKEGNLRSTTLHPHVEPWHYEVYLDEDSSFSCYPQKMVLQFKDREESKPNDSNSNQVRPSPLNIKGCSTSLILLPLTLIMSIFFSSDSPSLPSDSLSYTTTHQLTPVSTSTDLEYALTAEQGRHTNARSIVKTVEYSPSRLEFPATAMIAQTITPLSPTIETSVRGAKTTARLSDLD